MAVKYITALVQGGSVVISRRGDAAVGDALDTACDAALLVTEIDAEVNAEAAVEAIRTAVDAAIATEAGHVTVTYDTASATTINHVVRGLEAILHTLRGSF